MPAPFFPNVRCFARATALQTELALSVLKLFKAGFTPTPATVDTDLDAQECDFTTYAAQTITAWLNPVESTLTGAQITAPTEQWSLAATPAVANMVGGYWLETAAGDVVMIRQFDTSVPMAAAGNFVQVTATVVVPTGQG